MNGMPLLSMPPPENSDESDESACRKCNKEFNFIFARHKRCNHCGYAYCSSCTDFQALMPRTGPETGYEVHAVCAYCMDMLTITASSKSRLRALPLAKLRAYMKAYNIETDSRALEKDDLVEAIIRARGLDGCLFPPHEDYYRRNSVPKRRGERTRSRSFFGRQPRQPSPPPIPPPNQRQYAPPPGPPPPQARTSTAPRPPQPRPRSGSVPPQMQFPEPQPHHHHSPAPPQHPHPRPPPPPPSQQPANSYRPPPPRPAANNSFRPSMSQTNFHPRPPSSFPPQNQPPRQPQPPPRPRSAAPTVPTTPAAPPPPPPPSLDSLLEKSPDQISHLSISALKAVLFQNRVNSSSGVLEKEDLVRKVLALVEDERWERIRKEREEREEAERMEWARKEREKQEEARRAAEMERKLMEERQRGEEKTNTGEEAAGSVDVDPKPAPQPAPAGPPFPERTQDGLCVICQDEHANMAIIDCGHLALCKNCSEIVMKTSRECPLCRTRIVTEQRLLRIFKT